MSGVEDVGRASSVLRGHRAQALSDLGELRRVLDYATESLSIALRRVHNATWIWSTLPEEVSADQKTLLEGADEDASDGLTDAVMAWYRVTLRLGSEHPVSVSLNGAIDVLAGIRGVIVWTRGPSDAEKQQLVALEKTRSEGLEVFSKAAVQAVGSRL